MAHLFGTKKERILSLFSSGTILIFVVPIFIWTFLLWKEGGVCYLHEHFVNNIIGRFLHRHFELSGCHFRHTDVGNTAPWYWYIKRIPDMIGLTYPFILLALIELARRLKNLKAFDPKVGQDLLLTSFWQPGPFCPVPY